MKHLFKYLGSTNQVVIIKAGMVRPNELVSIIDVQDILANLKAYSYAFIQSLAEIMFHRDYGMYMELQIELDARDWKQEVITLD